VGLGQQRTRSLRIIIIQILGLVWLKSLGFNIKIKCSMVCKDKHLKEMKPAFWTSYLINKLPNCKHKLIKINKTNTGPDKCNFQGVTMESVLVEWAVMHQMWPFLSTHQSMDTVWQCQDKIPIIPWQTYTSKRAITRSLIELVQLFSTAGLL